MSAPSTQEVLVEWERNSIRRALTLAPQRTNQLSSDSLEHWAVMMRVKEVVHLALGEL